MKVAADSASWLKVTVVADSEMRLGLHGAGTGRRLRGIGIDGRCGGAGGHSGLESSTSGVQDSIVTGRCGGGVICGLCSEMNAWSGWNS